MERLTLSNNEIHTNAGIWILKNGNPKELVSDDCDEYEYFKKLAEYEDLEEQGKLLKLHCVRGDTIWFIKSAFSIAAFPIEAKITSICGVDCDNDIMYSAVTQYNGIDRKFKSSDIGKTVFLTKPEADAALEETQKGSAL